ncbi:4Fe-4S binding protein [Candidatus Bipolaricaulota bacterium]|nr:4Fe-4S binding protein [Candidatus Bipolaricaulota bacterium]
MSNSIDLSVKLADVTFRNPFIVGAGPSAKCVDHLRQAEDAGWAGASLKLAIEPFPYINWPPRYRWLNKSKLHIFTAETRLTAGEALKLLEEGRKATRELVLIPTITYDGGDYEGWAKLAKRFEDAGAQVIELNMCCPNMSFNMTTSGESTEKATGASLGSDLVELPRVVKTIVQAVNVPIIVKLTPEGGKIAQAAYQSIKAGAAAVGGVANRLGIPDIDIEDPMGTIYRLQDHLTLGCLSGPWIRPLALRDTYEMRYFLNRHGMDAFVLGSGGVTDLASTVEQIMVGADAVWICTETMIRGFDWLPKVIDELQAYMKRKGYRTIRDFRDLLHRNIKSADELVLYQGHAKVDLGKCNSCGMCWNIGHCPAISHPGDVTTIDVASCLGCSTCVDVCPRKALSMVQGPRLVAEGVASSRR